MYSVLLEEKNGKKYYRKSRKKYWIPDVGAQLIASIPEDSGEKMSYYYFEENAWHFDEDSYNAYLKEVENAQKEAEENVQEQISQEDILTGMMEIAENQSNMQEKQNKIEESISDLEAAVIELATLIAGRMV